MPTGERKRIVVAIPVRNEEERIKTCLEPLLAQTVPADDILVLLNNCEDATHAEVRRWQRRHPQIHIVERQLVGRRACAGEARRLALGHAADLAGDGILLTSDADAEVPRAWIEANLIELGKGAAVVCGRTVIAPREAACLPAGLRRQEAAQAACLALLDRIDALTDPDPADPWPRHAEESGASIALTAAILHRAGGAPSVSWGEDRALIARLRLIDAPVRHAPHIAVTVSGRLQGRARHGMAEALRRQLETPDEWADERLEPATGAYRRAMARAAARRAWSGVGDAARLADDLLVDRGTMRAALSQPCFGAAWVEIEIFSPVLRHRRLKIAELAREAAQARRLIAQLQALPGPFTADAAREKNAANAG